MWSGAAAARCATSASSHRRFSLFKDSHEPKTRVNSASECSVNITLPQRRARASLRPPRSVERAMNEATIEHLMSKIALKTQKNIELLLVSRRSYARSCCRVPRVCSVRGHECAVSVATSAQCPCPRVRSVRDRECRRPAPALVSSPRRHVIICFC